VAVAALTTAVAIAGFAVTRGSPAGVSRPADDPTPAGALRVQAPSAPRLPIPEDAPDDPYADVPVTEIGRIEIPKIGIDRALYEGIWLTVIDRGPGHWPGSAAPGQWGNTVIAGHRATHDKPFRHIDELVAGDEIALSNADGRFTYRVTGSEVVRPEAMDIVTQRPGHTLTIFACHPVGSAAFRYVVYGTLATA
jgi:sortase A